MSLLERKIDVQLALNGDTFDGSSNTVQLSGLRVQATITTHGGKLGPAVSNLQIRISGMKNADMAKLSTLGFNPGTKYENAINVFAGDDKNGMALVFQGAIVYGNVDYNSMPDVGLELVANELAKLQYASIAASSYQGDVTVASVIEGIASAAGKRFVNNGVTAVLSNPAVAGSANDQIRAIARAANINWRPKGDTIYIWPRDGSIDDTVIDVGPDTGMVGYPRYQMLGLKVTSIFNPAIEPGRLIKVKSSTPAPSVNNPVLRQGFNVPGANGTFNCATVVHNLESQTPGGPWFTEMDLYTGNVIPSFAIS